MRIPSANVQSLAKVLINMVAPGVRFVNVPLNQCVKGRLGYTVSVMNNYLWGKPLIRYRILQTHSMRPA
jgi:hypothetical protein